MLWERSLVMYDPETDTYWSHILGEAMAGKLQGEKLDLIPSVMTDWNSWLDQYPDTTVLWMQRTAREFDATIWQHPKDFVLGVVLAGQPSAWTYDYLIKRSPVQTELAGFPVLAVIDPESNTARLYDRRVDGTILQFEIRDGELVETETGARWNLVSGKPILAPGSDDQQPSLVPLPAIPSFRHSWLTFHPKSALAE